ncbi:MAG: hypothetical protein Q8Q09_16970 [Deltaproteobacteria bacterium]|nr:hypothetical protein [Deltaproteobacteria bacterium]
MILGWLAAGVGLMAATSIIPWVMWIVAKRKGEGRWTRRVEGVTQVGEDYRGAVAPTFAAPDAPIEVKLAAIGCWALGQMFIPGLAAGMFGLFVLVGLVSIPGLILAARLFLLGKPLLRGELIAAEKADSLAHFATILNTAILSIVGVGFLGTVATALVNQRPEALLVPLFYGLPIAFYAAISLLHANLLRRAAKAIVANHAANTVHDTQVRIEPMAPAYAPGYAPASVSEALPHEQASSVDPLGHSQR